MPFPESKKVTYEKHPLEQVICQLRFDPVLRIDAELPSTFQEAIRGDYPLFKEVKGVEQSIPQEFRKMFPPEILGVLNSAEPRRYDFSSHDGAWIVTLARNAISLTTTNYTTWQEFRSRFEKPLDTLIEVYAPIRFSRVGLRYRNVIIRSALDLENVDWSELLENYIAGIFGAPSVSPDSIQGSTSATEIALNEGCGIVRINHGTVQGSTSEQGYLIDTDFFIENIDTREKDRVTHRLNEFNRRAARLFRWCISDRLHNAMGPTER